MAWIRRVDGCGNSRLEHVDYDTARRDRIWFGNRSHPDWSFRGTDPWLTTPDGEYVRVNRETDRYDIPVYRLSPWHYQPLAIRYPKGEQVPTP